MKPSLLKMILNLLKILYKDKAQITDIFLMTVASIILIAISLFSYLIILFTIKIFNTK